MTPSHFKKQLVNLQQAIAFAWQHAHDPVLYNTVMEHAQSQMAILESHMHGTMHEPSEAHMQQAVQQLKLELESISHEPNPDLGYHAIDAVMQRICSSYCCSGQQLHNSFVDAVGMTPDDWVATQYYYMSNQHSVHDQPQQLNEAVYHGRRVQLNKPQRGGKKKFFVYVRDPKTGNVKRVSFGDKNMEIKRDDPQRRASYRARHGCGTARASDRTRAEYWSCRMWGTKSVSNILRGK